MGYKDAHINSNFTCLAVCFVPLRTQSVCVCERKMEKLQKSYYSYEEVEVANTHSRGSDTHSGRNFLICHLKAFVASVVCSLTHVAPECVCVCVEAVSVVV